MKGLTPQQTADMQKVFAPLSNGKTPNIFGNTPVPGTSKAKPKPVTQPAAFGNPQQPQQQANQQGYTQTTAPYGVDQSNPGVAEQFWNNNQNLWMNSPVMDWSKSQAPGQPQGNNSGGQGAYGPVGQGSQFWNQVQGTFNKASQDLTPQFNQYFDNARDSAVGAANKQAAARGVYGSSQALNNVGNVISNVEGQRANASTDFMFRNADNQRQALGQYGQMAFGAGREGLDLDAAQLGRANAGFSAAGAGQQFRDNRIQGMFDNIFRNQSMMLPWAQGNYDKMMDADSDYYMGAYEAGVGKAADAAGNARQVQSRVTNDAANAIGIANGAVDLGKKVKEY